MSERILLLDFLNLVHRANIKFGKPLNDQAISYTIVFNFFRSLRVLVEQFAPTKIFNCIEGSNNFRFSLYPEYKANRIIKQASKSPEEQEDIRRQANIIRELLAFLPIISVKAESYEADDVIATLVEDLKNENITIISGDSDFIQLLQKGYKNLQLYHPIKKIFIEAPEYFYVSWKALAGDASDNISALVNEKKAIELSLDPKSLQQFLSISAENRANYSLNLKLIDLKIISYDQLMFAECNPDLDRLREEFTKMQLPTMVADKYWARFKETFQPLLQRY